MVPGAVAVLAYVGPPPLTAARMLTSGRLDPGVLGAVAALGGTYRLGLGRWRRASGDRPTHAHSVRGPDGRRGCRHDGRRRGGRAGTTPPVGGGRPRALPAVPAPLTEPATGSTSFRPGPGRAARRESAPRAGRGRCPWPP